MSRLKNSWEIEEDIKNTDFSKYPEMEKLFNLFKEREKPEGSSIGSYTHIWYRGALQNMVEAVQNNKTDLISRYVDQIKKEYKIE